MISSKRSRSVLGVFEFRVLLPNSLQKKHIIHKLPILRVEQDKLRENFVVGLFEFNVFGQACFKERKVMGVVVHDFIGSSVLFKKKYRFTRYLFSLK